VRVVVVEHVGFARHAEAVTWSTVLRSVPRRRRGYSDSIPHSAVWQMSTLPITTTRLCYMGHPTAETSGLHSCCLDVVQISMRGTKRDTQLHRRSIGQPGDDAGARLHSYDTALT